MSLFLAFGYICKKQKARTGVVAGAMLLNFTKIYNKTGTSIYINSTYKWIGFNSRDSY